MEPQQSQTPVPSPVYTPPSPLPPKNNTNVILIVLVVILIIIVTIGFIFLNSTKDTSNIQSQESNIQERVDDVIEISKVPYVDPSGLYTISIPRNWTVSQVGNGVVVSDLGKKEQISGLNYTTLDHELGFYLSNNDPLPEEKVRAGYLNKTYTQESVIIDGISSTHSTYKELKAKINTYVIPLNSTSFLVVSVVARDGSDIWLKEAGDVVKSMSVDVSKAIVLKQQNQDTEGTLKLINTIKGVAPTAEMYRDSNPNYIGFCTSADLARIVINEVKSAVGAAYKCTDGNSYAFSSKLPDGKFYCVDSTRFSGNVSALHTGSACK